MSSLSKKLLGRKILLAMACASLLTGYSSVASAAVTLEEYITQSTEPSKSLSSYSVNSDHYATGAIGTTAGSDGASGKERNVFIWNGSSIIGQDSTKDGFTVANEYTLNLTGTTGSTLKGFATGIVVNSGGTANVTDMTLNSNLTSNGTINYSGKIVVDGDVELNNAVVADTAGDDFTFGKADGTSKVNITSAQSISTIAGSSVTVNGNGADTSVLTGSIKSSGTLNISNSKINVTDASTKNIYDSYNNAIWLSGSTTLKNVTIDEKFANNNNTGSRVRGIYVNGTDTDVTDVKVITEAGKTATISLVRDKVPDTSQAGGWTLGIELGANASMTFSGEGDVQISGKTTGKTTGKGYGYGYSLGEIKVTAATSTLTFANTGKTTITESSQFGGQALTNYGTTTFSAGTVLINNYIDGGVAVEVENIGLCNTKKDGSINVTNGVEEMTIFIEGAQYSSPPSSGDISEGAVAIYNYSKDGGTIVINAKKLNVLAVSGEDTNKEWTIGETTVTGHTTFNAAKAQKVAKTNEYYSTTYGVKNEGMGSIVIGKDTVTNIHTRNLHENSVAVEAVPYTVKTSEGTKTKTNGSIEILGDTTIVAEGNTGTKSLYATDGNSITIGSDGKTVSITGDILSTGSGISTDEEGEAKASSITVAGATNTITGNVEATNGGSVTLGGAGKTVAITGNVNATDSASNVAIGGSVAVTQNVTLASGAKLTLQDNDATTKLNISGNFDATTGSLLSFDAVIGAAEEVPSDSIAVSGTASGTVTIDTANITISGDTSEVFEYKVIHLFTGSNLSGLTITTNGKAVATSEGYKYDFVQNTDTEGDLTKGDLIAIKSYAGTLADIVQNKTIADYEMGKIVTYSLVEDYTSNEDLGTLTRVTGETTRNLTIYGNGFILDGGSHAGITVNSGDSLTLKNAELRNFAGDVFTNAGTLNIVDVNVGEGYTADVTNSGTFTADGEITLIGSVTNSGTFTTGGNTSITSSVISITGSVINSGTFTASGTTSITGSVTNSGTFTNSGTVTGTVTNNGTLINYGTITTIADGLKGALENNKDLVLTGGTLGSDITGTGTTTIAGSVTNSKAIANAVKVNAGSSFTLADKATVSGDLTNNGTTNVTGSDVVLNGDTSTFAATGTTNITGKLTATTGVLSFAGTDNFVIASGGTLVTQAKNFIDVGTYAAVNTALAAAKLESGASLDLLFYDEKPTTYTTDDLKKVRTAYSSDNVSFIDRTLELDDSEQLVIKRDTDEASTSIVIGGKPQVVEKNNNVKEVAVTKVPKNYVAVVQQAEGKSPELQTVEKVKITSDFASKGLQVASETGKVEMKIAGSVVMTGGSDASSGIVVDENGKGLDANIEVDESGYFQVGVATNTEKQKGKLGNVSVKGEHALAGNDATKTDYTYEQLTVGAETATVAVTKAALTVNTLSAGNGSIFVDPAYLAINELENNTLGINIYVGEGSVTNIAGDATELRKAVEDAGLTTTDASTGFTVASDETVLGIDGNISLTAGKKLIVDSAVDSSGNDTNNTTGAQVYFGDGSLLVVNAEKAVTAPVIKLNTQTVKVGDGAKLYLRNALAKKTYTIVSGASTDENGIKVAGWGNDGGEKTGETTLYANRLLKYTAQVVDGSYIINTSQDLDPSVFQGTFVYPALKEIADKNLLDANSSYGGIKFLSRATDANYVNDAQMTPVMEEMAAVASTAGVQHTALRASDLVVDTIGEHLSVAKAEKGANLWATPLRTSLTTTSRTESTANISGIMVGYDKGNEKGRFGVAVQGGWGTSHSEGAVSYYQNKNKFAGVSLYGSQKIGSFDLKASLGYTKFGNDVRTNLANGLNMGTVNTDIDAKAFTADVRVERTYETKSGLGITPHVGLRYTRLSTDSYDNYIISGDSEKQNIWQLPIGVTFAQTLSKKEGWTLRPYLDLSFVPAFGGKETDSRVRFTGLNSVVSSATRIIDSTSFLGSLGFGAERGKFGMGLSYTLQKGSSEMNSTLALNLNWKF